MENVGGAVRLVLVTLCCVELAVTLLRLRHREARREAVWMSMLLAAFACRLLVPRGGTGLGGMADVAVPSCVLLCTGNLLIAINRTRGSLAWSLGVAGLAGILVGIDLLFVHDPEAERLLRAVPFAGLAIPPVALLVLLWRKTGEIADLIVLGVAAAWGLAVCLEAARVLPVPLSDWLLAPLLLMIGFMVFEQGYLSPLTSSGYVDRLAAQRRLSRETYTRLIQREDALAAQDRLITAGLLAIGASHEFKNVLASVRMAAAHGLASPAAEVRGESLRLTLELADAGAASATAFLERLGMEGREEPVSCAVRPLFDRIARFARPSLLSAGIGIELRCDDALAVTGRPPEIEQILLNLVRNSVDAFVSRALPEPRLVSVRGAAEDGGVVLSVRDNAGGIGPRDAAALFSLGRSGVGSTGIGLYLARSLAERNGGSLTHSPLDGGSEFLLRLPPAPRQ